jgi:hypothetical protein
LLLLNVRTSNKYLPAGTVPPQNQSKKEPHHRLERMR